MNEQIQQAIAAAIPGATTHVASPDGRHFEAIVISPAFDGLSLVKQHQLVMRALKAAFDGDLHALQLKTFTPRRWEEEKEQHNV